MVVACEVSRGVSTRGREKKLVLLTLMMSTPPGLLVQVQLRRAIVRQPSWPWSKEKQGDRAKYECNPAARQPIR